jgi:hypothetical protein
MVIDEYLLSSAPQRKQQSANIMIKLIIYGIFPPIKSTRNRTESIRKMPIILPKLIKEMINYYSWRNNMKIVNQEYKEKVSINDISTMTQLIWCYRGQIAIIAILDIKNSTNSIWYLNVIRSWKNGKKVIKNSSPSAIFAEKYLRKPKNYHYSSGMNNDSGYSNAGLLYPESLFIWYE